MSELLNMGGFGLYVWSAYGITLSVFGINLWLFIHEKKQVKKILQQKLRSST